MGQCSKEEGTSKGFLTEEIMEECLNTKDTHSNNYSTSFDIQNLSLSKFTRNITKSKTDVNTTDILNEVLSEKETIQGSRKTFVTVDEDEEKIINVEVLNLMKQLDEIDELVENEN